MNTSVLVVVCLWSAVLPAEKQAAPEPRELLDRYRKAATAWDKSVSMRVEYDQSVNERGRDLRHWKYDITHRRDGDRGEWFGRCHFEGKLDGESYSFNEDFRDLVTEDYFLRYSRSDSPRESEALMGTEVRDRLLTLQTRSADGGFLQGRTAGIGTATHLAEAMCDGNEPRYLGQEILGGTLCYIVEARTKYGTITVWLAPQKGYNALKCLWRKSGRDIMYSDVRAEDLHMVAWTQTIDAIEVQAIDGVFVPVAGRLTDSTQLAGGEECEEHTTARRRDIVLHPDFRALGAFQVVFPEGTEVRVAGGSGRTFIWSQGKFTPDIMKYLVRSLRGKPVPDLKAICRDWDRAGAAAKRLLICFLDVQQRPSRQIALQVVRRADSLQQQGVTVMVIQGAKMEEVSFQKWVKENQIPFPTGMVQGEEDEARAGWGVKALPWLILTDEKHIVRAEGFGPDELESRIEALGKE
jgi:hypothetical protein